MCKTTDPNTPYENPKKEQLAMFRCVKKQKPIFPKELDKILDKHSLSQKQHARKLNVDTSTLTRWRDGSRYPDTGSIYAIAKKLNLLPEQRSFLLDCWMIDKNKQFIADYVEKTIEEDADDELTDEFFADH